ncbi:hypothetical protein D9M68_913170 [compost metagenome]
MAFAVGLVLFLPGVQAGLYPDPAGDHCGGLFCGDLDRQQRRKETKMVPGAQPDRQHRFPGLFQILEFL